MYARVVNQVSYLDASTVNIPFCKFTPSTGTEEAEVCESWCFVRRDLIWITQGKRQRVNLRGTRSCNSLWHFLAFTQA